MKKNLFLLMVLIILFVTPQRTSPMCSQTDEAKLSKILNKTAKYCERVKSIALFYVCQEEIRDKANFYSLASVTRTTIYGQEEVPLGLRIRRTRSNSYLYDYQLIKEGEDLSEQRILLKKNGRKMRKENAELEVKSKSKYIIYGPVGFLSRYWQDYFDYEIIGKKRIEKKKATIIKATPKSNNEENRNFAKIWIHEEDGSIIQIEWEPESIDDYVEKNIETFVGNLKTAVVWRVTYGIEKNGVRFPSRQHVQEFLATESDKRYILNETITVLNNYKFFIVEYEIKNRP
ncbi:MAG: hypothetical protein PVF66_12530 [Candidatus Aminicenantes bacterium]